MTNEKEKYHFNFEIAHTPKRETLRVWITPKNGRKRELKNGKDFVVENNIIKVML